MATLRVEVVTAERELYNGEADEVNAPGIDGRLGILPEHAPLLTVLKPGALRITLNNAEEVLFVSGGFMEVSDNGVTVLADAAEHAEEIDQARAEAARRAAQQRLEEVRSNTERAEMQAALQRALNRIRIIELTKRSGRRRISSRPPSEQ